MVNFHILVISLAVSLWSREVHSMDCSEICRVPELIYHCCQCIGCHQGEHMLEFSFFEDLFIPSSLFDLRIL